MSVIPVSALPGRNSYATDAGGRFGQLGNRGGGRFGYLGSRVGGPASDRYPLPRGVGPAIRAGLGPTAHARPQFSDGTQKHSLPQQTAFRQQLLDILNIESQVDINMNQPVWQQASASHVHSARPPEPLRIYLPDADAPYTTPFVPTYIGRSPPVHGARAGQTNPALLRGGSLPLLSGGAVRRCRKYTKRRCRQPAPGLNAIGRRYCGRYTRRRCQRYANYPTRRRRTRRALPGAGPGPGPDPGPGPRGPPSPRPRPPGPGPARPPDGAGDGLGPWRPPAVDHSPWPRVPPEERKYRDDLHDLDFKHGYGPWGAAPYVPSPSPLLMPPSPESPAFPVSRPRVHQEGMTPREAALQEKMQMMDSLMRPYPGQAFHIDDVKEAKDGKEGKLGYDVFGPVNLPMQGPQVFPARFRRRPGALGRIPHTPRIPAIPLATPRDHEGPVDFTPDTPHPFAVQPYHSPDDDVMMYNFPVNPGGLVPAIVAPPMTSPHPMQLDQLGVVHGSLIPSNPDNQAPAVDMLDYLPPAAHTPTPLGMPQSPDVLREMDARLGAPPGYMRHNLRMHTPRSAPLARVKTPVSETPPDSGREYSPLVLAGLKRKRHESIATPKQVHLANYRRRVPRPSRKYRRVKFSRGEERHSLYGPGERERQEAAGQRFHPVYGYPLQRGGRRRR